ncbi:hypothetical protein Q9233_017383 [Columba guinea]|nr:hypothetical protein Q9233_017383 [Columba guinea]
MWWSSETEEMWWSSEMEEMWWSSETEESGHLRSRTPSQTEVQTPKLHSMAPALGSVAAVAAVATVAWGLATILLLLLLCSFFHSPSSRTPEFLRHRQLPVLPGDAGTAATDPVPDAEGRIYESIRYKPGTLKKPQDAGSTLGDSGDSPFLTRGDEPSVPELDITAQEELDSKGDPSPVYARVCKPPRGTQPQQPHSPPEPQEEAPPALPEKRFDVA